jgi:hypothetical protein
MKRIALALVLILVAVGCGSTNKKDVADGGDRTAESVTGSSAAPDGTGAPDSTATTTGGKTSATLTGGAGAAGDVPGSKGGKSSSGLPLGTGSIKIGFHYSENLDTAYRALGASGSFVNIVAALESMVKYVNAHGGLGGKKVVPVFHGTDPLIGTFSAQAETACTHFTQDEKVFAVISGAVLPDINMPACHAKYKTPLMWDYQYLLDKAKLNSFGNYLYMPHAIATERYGFYVDALWQSKFITKDTKVGVMRYDDPQHKRFYDTVIKPGLAKHGLVAIDKAVSRPQSAGEAGDTGQQASSAMLDLRSKDVTRVLFVPSGGAIPLITGKVADGQHYYPRYAFTSFDIPNFVTDNMTDEQLAGGVTLGWMPPNDTYLTQLPKNASTERCYKAAGIRSLSVVRFCDGLFLLKDSLDKTPLFNVAGLSEAIHALGDDFKTPWSLSTKMASGRHDGASSFKLMRFSASCSCFKYEGSSKPVP